MKTAQRGAAPPDTTAGATPAALGKAIAPGKAKALAGPALIVVSVIVAMRGFGFADLLTNQHPDILSFWLPRSCLMGRSLAAGHIPLWNPFEMAGTPFAADPQSGWLYLPWMLTGWLFPCGVGLRVFIVLQPLLAGLGLFWFLRKEGLHRAAATAGGLSLAMAIAASKVAISLPFAGTLAWTPFVLVGASGYLREKRWRRRLPWLALSALAWGQVASAHMSHGLVMASGLLVAFVVARSVRDVRTGHTTVGRAVLVGLALFAFLPLANLAILIPRFALIGRSSLRGGYAALGGTLARAAGVEDRPLPTAGVFSGWPFQLGSTPGAYAGAAILLLVPASLRATGRRYLSVAFATTGAAAYLLTLNLFVGAAWFRSFVLRLPYGDVYLHNPGRLRYLALIVVAVLGAIGIQGWLERPPVRRNAYRLLGAGTVLFLVTPLVLGANPLRFVVLAIGAAATVPVLLHLLGGRRWAVVALPLVLAAELMGGALWSSAYDGGTVRLGLEGDDHPALVPQPLRWPDIPVDRYLGPSPIVRYLQRQGPDDGRYLAWIQPAVDFNKGYLFTQRPSDWPALLLGRAVLFELHDVLGYSPIQLPRYWSYIRATNPLPVFYNASILTLPSVEDVRLLGIRYLIVPVGFPLPEGLSGRVIASDRGYDLHEVDGWETRVSVVPRWVNVASGVRSLQAVLGPGFDPASKAVLEEKPGITPVKTGTAGSATYREVRPEDVRITATADVPSLVVVRNAWDRGWSASVDGHPARLLRADYFLQAVPIPAGTHEVRLTYTDPAIGRGLLASALVWLILTAVFVALSGSARRRARSPGTPQA
ncbi:MAG: hypothetical protein AB1551_03335 [Actinomycetota bacterium]